MTGLDTSSGDSGVDGGTKSEVKSSFVMNSKKSVKYAGTVSVNGTTSKTFKGLSSSSKVAQDFQQQMMHHEKRSWHAPMTIVVPFGGMLPFVVMTFLAWYVFSHNTDNNITRIYDSSQESIRDLVESKIDSVIDAEVEAFRTLYEGAVKVVNSGAFLEHAIASYSYEYKQKRTAFWTQTISQAYHYRLTYFIYSCHGHIMGTGYDPTTSEYIAYYTDVHVFDYNTTDFTSSSGTEYDEIGCNTADFFGVTSKELTHTKKFTDETYWSNILDPAYEDHDTATFEDGRLRSWYMRTHKSTDECTWTLPYVADQIPRNLSDYVSTISMKTFDDNGVEHGVVAVDLSLDRLNTFINELSAAFPGTYSIVLSNEQRVMAATDGDIIHEFTLNGEDTSELYEFTDYAEERKRKDENYVYLALADYLYDNPDYFMSLQDLHFDIGDPDLRPEPEHFKVYTDFQRPVIVSALHMTDHCGLDVTLMIMADEDYMMIDINKYHQDAQDEISEDTIITLIIVPVIGIILLGFLILVARGVSLPLAVMCDDVAKVKELDFNGGFEKQKPFIAELSSIARDYAGLKAVMKRFRCFVPPQIIAELVSEGGVGGRKRTVENRYISTLFCDVANFTKVSHKCDQRLVLEFANAFLGGAADLIVKNKGTVIDFFGDQIFGIFNAPVEDPDFLVCTITSATKIIKLFDKAKAHFMKKDPQFAVLDVRIGLHSGSALVGKIGSEGRLKYCAIGENVNLGSRLEAINKRYGSRMTCSSDFLFTMGRDAKRQYSIRPMEFIRVNRREAPVLIYEIAGLTAELSPEVVTEFKEHAEMFQRVKAKRVSNDELEAFIKTKGRNAKFLRSGSMLSDSAI